MSQDLSPEGKPSILVVDDVETVRAVSLRMLERLGFDAVAVEGGAEAIELLKANPDRFSVVLLDLSMPDMSGQDTLDIIRGIAPDLAVVLMTGYSERATRGDFLQSRPQVGFLEKPFRPEALREQIEAVRSRS